MTHAARAKLMFLIFLNGYISLSLELVVLRYLSFWVGSSAIITSIIMGMFLGFMSLGYFLGNARRVKNSNIYKIVGLSFFVIAAISLAAGSFPLISEYFSLMYMAGARSSVVQTFIFSVVLLSVGPFLFGFNTTLMSRLLSADKSNQTGVIMAMDTIGSVLGSLLTTLILMPLIGVNNTVIVICGAGVIGALMMWRRWYMWPLALGLMVFTAYINSNWYQRTRFAITVNNSNSTIQIAPINNGRILYMNSLPMSLYFPDTRMSAEYINYVNDTFIYSMPTDERRRILILGAGGFTAGLNDTFHDYTYVDIEPTLKEISETQFLGEKLTPNKKFVVQDASQFLKNTDRMYDLIMLDVYSNSYQVPESLITAEFMMRIKARVAPGGIVVMNIVSSPAFDDEYSRVFDNTFNSVFSHNTSRNVIGDFNPWQKTGNEPSNIIYVWYNRENSGRIYDVNNSSVLYDIY